MDAEPVDALQLALARAVSSANARITERSHIGVYPPLYEAVTEYERQGGPPSPLVFLAHRLLGQCARLDRKFDPARAHYMRALHVADQMRNADGVSAALEGLAFVEHADHNPEVAFELFERAVEYARLDGPGLGVAMVLQNYANVLFREGNDRAADMFREALAEPGLTPFHKALITDNLGNELARQGDWAAAVAHCGEAAHELERLGARHDAYKAYGNLSAAARGHDDAAAVAAFVRAHDLIHQLAVDEVDHDHYHQFPERARQIEEETHKNYRENETGMPAFLAIGIAAKLGADKVEEGEKLIFGQRYTEAEHALRLAESLFTELGAYHVLPRVWSSLGLLYMTIGRFEQAWSMLQRARLQAHQLGDALRERIALTNLASLVSRGGLRIEIDELEYVARARALLELEAAPIREQLAANGGGGGQEIPLDGGVLDSIAYGLCEAAGALDLAETYLRRSLAAIDSHGEDLASSSTEPEPDGPGAFPRVKATMLARRLGRLAIHLTQRDPRHAEVPALVERLLELRARYDDPALALATENSLSMVGLYRGERTAQTLRHLIAACDAHEALRLGATDALGPDGLADIAEPPYGEAVSIALNLGRTNEAFALLERSKARQLLDAIRAFAAPGGQDPRAAEEAGTWRQIQQLRAAVRQLTDDLPVGDDARARSRRLFENNEELQPLEERLRELWAELALTNPSFLTHRRAEPNNADDVLEFLARQPDAALVEFFPDKDALHLFRFTGGALDCVVVLGADDVEDYNAMVALLDDDADDAWDRLLADPAYLRLVEAIDEIPAARRYVVPYGVLHRAPLYLNATGDARAGTVLLPSASLLRTAATAPTYTGATSAGVLVAGDPTLDLPFARVECDIAAQRFGTVATKGSEVTFAWLVEAMSAQPRPRLLHLACHGYFDEHRAERSGLILAGDGTGGRLVTLGELATIDWSGVLAVLSACESGQHNLTRGGDLAGITQTLLAAGALATLTTLRPVPDISTAVLMTWFYEALDPAAEWKLDDVSAALAAAQRRMRASTAKQLASWASEIAGQGGAQLLLAAKVLAVAHRAAGRTSGYVAWESFTHELQQGGKPVGATDIGREAEECADDDRYQGRPFAAARHWAAFGVHGAGWRA